MTKTSISSSIKNSAKNVVESSIPMIENGVSKVYDTMSSGLDLGVKSVKSVTNKITNNRSSRKRSSRKRSSRRSKKGGKKSRRHRKR